jgi:hypothetical protein
MSKPSCFEYVPSLDSLCEGCFNRLCFVTYPSNNKHGFKAVKQEGISHYECLASAVLWNVYRKCLPYDLNSILSEMLEAVLPVSQLHKNVGHRINVIYLSLCKYVC